MKYVLCEDISKAYNPKNPEMRPKSRPLCSVLWDMHPCSFIVSWYLTGYDLTLEDIKQFRQWGSRTPGHPEYGYILPIGKVRNNYGSFGSGFFEWGGNGPDSGAVILLLISTERGLHIVDHYTYCIASDGDLMEGISSEAASLAGNLELGKLYLFL